MGVYKEPVVIDAERFVDECIERIAKKHGRVRMGKEV